MEILTLQPEFGLTEDIEFKTLVTEMETGYEKRRAKWTYPLRNYKLNLYAYNADAMQVIWDFFAARKGSLEAFLVKIPTEFEVVGEAVATGNGVLQTFLLDEFPVDTTAGTFKGYVNGIQQSATLTNDFVNEQSKITFAAPPGDTLPITADYNFYFKVRFRTDLLTRELMSYHLQNTGLELREDRWSSYRPRKGNA